MQELTSVASLVLELRQPLELVKGGPDSRYRAERNVRRSDELLFIHYPSHRAACLGTSSKNLFVLVVNHSLSNDR